MKLGDLSAYYYTAAEARKVLGIDEDAFQYWGRKGRIQKIKLPGRAQAVYSKSEVNKLAAKIEATVLVEHPEQEAFRKATINDIEKEAQLAHLVFGEKAEAIEERTAFLKENPDIDYHLYDDGNLVAYINIVPFEHQLIEDFMDRKIPNIWKVDTKLIQQFEPDKPLECLIIDMVTTPTVPPRKRSSYGARLIAGLVELLVEMGRNGINISKVYSASRTPSGIKILQNAGFTKTKEENGRVSFMLDITTSEERILREYKEVLNMWQKSQNQKNERNRKKGKTE